MTLGNFQAKYYLLGLLISIILVTLGTKIYHIINTPSKNTIKFYHLNKKRPFEVNHYFIDNNIKKQ